MSKGQINEAVQKILATALLGELESPGFLVTITAVKCAPDFSVAKILVSVLPDKFSGTALKNLRKKSKVLSEIIKKRFNLTKGPFLEWKIDDSLKRVSKIEDTLEKIKQGE